MTGAESQDGEQMVDDSLAVQGIHGFTSAVRAYLFCLEYLAEEGHCTTAADTDYDKFVTRNDSAPAIIRPFKEFSLVSQAGR